jgi:DNA-binding IclR family transcriptional regulator
MRTIEKPTYLLESVDNALRLLQMLRDLGVLRLTDAAQELGIAPSTAHRLFAMLMYRGFAVQDEKRGYHPGPAMGAGPAQRGWTREFNELCRPHMEALSMLCGETVNLVIRVGTQVRFLSSAESTQPLRVGDRQGQVLPAELTAGGRILLAGLPRDVLERLYLRPVADDGATWGDRRLPPDEFDSFFRDLQAAKAVGFALNVQRTEEGVAAFGVAVRNRSGRAIGAISVSAPITRYRQHARGPLVSQLKNAVREVEVDVADIQPESRISA